MAIGRLPAVVAVSLLLVTAGCLGGMGLGDVDAAVRELAGTETTMIEWDADGLSYTVNGDLETDELAEVAESIVD